LGEFNPLFMLFFLSLKIRVVMLNSFLMDCLLFMIPKSTDKYCCFACEKRSENTKKVNYLLND